MRALAIALVVLAACEPHQPRRLALDVVRVLPDARLRTDAIGDGKFEEQATFVLVDAENTGREGAYVTLTGEVADAAGTVVGQLSPQSLWMPAGEIRTFALVDHERKPRPTASAAKVTVRGALVPESPPMTHIGELRELEDNGRIVVQGVLRNEAARAGNIMVIASFHDADGRPMTRPFSMIRVPGNDHETVQFVGPPGSKHGTIFTGDAVF